MRASGVGLITYAFGFLLGASCASIETVIGYAMKVT